MAQNLTFNFKDLPVRIVDQDGEPWFVAKDICDILKIKNNRDALMNMPENEKGVVNADTPGGNQEMTIISEPGLYRLIFKSRVKAAEEFKSWVVKDVLPSIRKTGKYKITSEVLEQRITIDMDWVTYNKFIEFENRQEFVKAEKEMTIKLIQDHDFEPEQLEKLVDRPLEWCQFMYRMHSRVGRHKLEAVND